MISRITRKPRPPQASRNMISSKDRQKSLGAEITAHFRDKSGQHKKSEERKPLTNSPKSFFDRNEVLRRSGGSFRTLSRTDLKFREEN